MGTFKRRVKDSGQFLVFTLQKLKPLMHDFLEISTLKLAFLVGILFKSF